MEAILKQVLVKPASYYESGDKEGELKVEEYAAINLNIPMDTKGQEESVIALFALLRNRRVHIQIVAEQPELELGLELGNATIGETVVAAESKI